MSSVQLVTFRRFGLTVYNRSEWVACALSGNESVQAVGISEDDAILKLGEIESDCDVEDEVITARPLHAGPEFQMGDPDSERYMAYPGDDMPPVLIELPRVWQDWSCPSCGERWVDRLVMNEPGRMYCASCETHFVTPEVDDACEDD